MPRYLHSPLPLPSTPRVRTMTLSVVNRPSRPGLLSISKLPDLLNAFSDSNNYMVHSQGPDAPVAFFWEERSFRPYFGPNAVTADSITVGDLDAALKKPTTFLWLDNATSFPMPPGASYALVFTVDVQEADVDVVLAATLIRLSDFLGNPTSGILVPRMVDLWFEMDVCTVFGVFFFGDDMMPIYQNIKSQCLDFALDRTQLAEAGSAFFGEYPMTVWNSLVQHQLVDPFRVGVEKNLMSTWDSVATLEPLAFIVPVETQHRGTLHAHLLRWLPPSHPREDGPHGSLDSMNE